MDLVVGRVVKTHGVRGELVVDVRTDDPQTRFAVGARLTGRAPKGAGTTEYTVTAARNHSGRLLLSLQGVADRSAADALRGTVFIVDASDVDSGDDPDEFYDHELEGAQVVTVDGADVGVLASILHLPGGDVLAVRADDGREVLVPFVRDMVPTVTRERIEIDPPEGLIDLDAAVSERD